MGSCIYVITTKVAHDSPTEKQGDPASTTAVANRRTEVWAEGLLVEATPLRGLTGVGWLVVDAHCRKLIGGQDTAVVKPAGFTGPYHFALDTTPPLGDSSHSCS